MNRLAVVFGLLLSLVLIAFAGAETPGEKPTTVTIPREKIIFAGPGAREFRDLEPEMFEYRDTPEKIAKYSTPEGIKEFKRIIDRANKESLVIAIERAMNALPNGKDAKTGPGFAVEGHGRAALQGIYDVLVKRNQPQKNLSGEKELSLIFYSPPMQDGIRLQSVARTGKEFQINFVMVSRASLSTPWFLAVVPIGKLVEGEYHVKLERCKEKEAEYNERGFPPVNPGAEKRHVCQPFSFTVKTVPSTKGGGS